MDPSDQGRSDFGYGAPRHADGPTPANRQPFSDDRWLRSVVENSSEIVTIVDPDGTLRYANPAFERVLSYELDEAIGTMNVLDHVHPEDLPHVLKETEKALGEGGVATNKAEYRFRHKDGSWRWMESVGTYLLDDPEVGGVVVTSRDVSERKEAEERYRTLVEHIPAVTYIDRIDEVNSAVYMSPQVEEMLGYSPEKWREDPKFLIKILHPDDKERILAEARRTNETGDPFGEEYRVISKSGHVVWVRDEAGLVKDREGKPLFWQGVVHDITERRRVEAALKESEQRFRRSFDDAAVGMALVETDGRFLRVNRSLCEILGYPERELLEKTFQEITHPDDLEVDVEHLRRLLARKIRTYQTEKRYLHQDGHVVWALLSVSVVHDEEGEPLYFVSQIQNVSERKALEESLRHQGLHDLLTGLPNRHLFLERLGHALARTGRRRGRRVAVLFMDLDDFKIVNDSLGHEMGDRLLVAVGERLKGCLRPEDTLARFGGDEFVVLLEDVEGPDEPVRVAERITHKLRDPFVLDGRELYARTSIGIAMGEVRTKDPDDLLRDADTAMYRSKDQGLGYSVFDPAMYQRALDRLEAVNELRRAIERVEFVVHYQPIVSLQSGEVFAVEALVRWEHPERGLLEPSEFVPMAEESGLVVPMGEQVLREACFRAKEWQEKHPRTQPLRMAVNLSARQLSRTDLAETVERMLLETGMEGSHLILDVTETAYVRALETNTAALERLRSMGVRIFIDDFGTGYSSLSYLKRLPADAIKIDKSFVKGLGQDDKDTAIIRMIIELAHTLGMKVIAEGVEAGEQAALLREMGCDMAQGLYFVKPLPAEASPEFLAATPT
jgi:diguanylate cyclase (GGDEF)-like protein/PAS domain S-box-containing protein